MPCRRQVIHRAPRKVRLRNRLDEIVRIFFHDVMITTDRFESNIHFDVRAFDMYVSSLQSIGQTAFNDELA